MKNFIIIINILFITDSSFCKIKLKPFYFVRHGKTSWNDEQKLQGQQEIPLNDVGVQQAKDLEPIISKLHIDYVFYSPLKRASQTVDIACSHLLCPKIALDQLKECYLGYLEGTPEKFFMNRVKEPEYNGEPLKDFIERIIEGVNLALSYEGTPLIVGHGGTYDILTSLMNIKVKSPTNCVLLYFSPSIDNQSWTVSEVIKIEN